ncbi:hypothetical protein DL95DRAFT_381234 [Leptodontidium sp. 2 PMI_412]|nr:hypothetical protein DL95DRAFT_381234 [Leptodontidium sp. 2 PMI_412]
MRRLPQDFHISSAILLGHSPPFLRFLVHPQHSFILSSSLALQSLPSPAISTQLHRLPIHTMGVLYTTKALEARSVLQARSAFSDFFTYPMILGIIIIIFLMIGIAAMVKIYRGNGGDGRTMPM